MPTKIPYAKETCNATVGCTHSGMPGCDNCFAEKLHTMRHNAYLAGKKVPKQYAKPFHVVQLMPERLERVLRRRKPTRYFWCSMSDLFHDDVPFSFIDDVFSVMRRTPQHHHLWLTKRPERMLAWFEHFRRSWDRFYAGRSNLIELGNTLSLGISCSTQDDLDKMVPILFQIPAATYWLSLEPLLEEIDIQPCLPEEICGGCEKLASQITVHAGDHWVSGPEPNLDEPCGPIVQREGFTWVIVGCESIHRKPGRFCENEDRWWAAARSIRDQCRAAGVAFYMKQGPINGKVVTDPKDFPEDMRIREVPK